MKKQFLKKSHLGISFSAAALIIAATIYSCTKHSSSPVTGDESAQPKLKVNTAQPLPGGKANFSVVMGNLDATAATDVRVVNWTFNASAGTVGATIWEWNSDDHKGKTLLTTHTCSMDGITKTNDVFVPTGWQTPAGQYYGRTGTYTYSGSTLTINWDAPWSTVHETWTVTNPDAASARVDFVSSNYGLTHGRGFGSNKPWTGTGSFYTVTSIPRISYPGSYIMVHNSGGTITVTPSTAGAWHTDALNLTGWTSSSNGNTLHIQGPNSPNVCQTGCTAGNTHTGIIYHLSSTNQSRAMAYNHYCACLPTEANFPVYTGNLHPYAFMQIIDDNGDLRGFVGIEEQNESSSTYQMQLKAYFQ